MVKIWRIHYTKRIAKDHFGNDIHSHTFECRVQIHRQVFLCQRVESDKELLDLTLELWGDCFNSFRREERVQHLSANTMDDWVYETNR